MIMGIQNLTPIVLSLLLFLSLPNLPISQGETPNRLVTKLIHYNSISSPYYNSSETVHQRAQRTIRSSISRFAYLSSKVSNDEIPKAYLDLVPSSALPQFFVNFSIGQPPIPQLVVMDTGSSLLWVKCLPCPFCYSDGSRIFDPSRSSTYSIVPCDHSFDCGSYSCSPMKKCTYYMQYVEGPFSKGYLSSEQITVDNGQGELVVVDGVEFGCGHENGDFRDANFNGVLGLGITRYDKSIVRRLGSKFSYCTGDVKDPHYSYNRLAFGQGFVMDGSPSTNLRSIGGHYYVTLEGISIGVTRLEIDPTVFKKVPQVNNGVIIDSGTGLTFLAKSAFQALSNEIEGFFEWDFARSEHPTLPLCYQGEIDRDLQDFPVIGLHFSDGADLVLDVKSSFIQAKPDVFCLAFVPSDINRRNHENLTIIGMLAQQNYNVGYDLETMKIYFQGIDCQFLDD